MKQINVSQLVFLIAAVVVGAWLLGLIFKIAAWLINGLLYVAAIIVIIALISAYLENQKTQKK
jgi:FtsH-binding integral membrane protein